MKNLTLLLLLFVPIIALGQTANSSSSGSASSASGNNFNQLETNFNSKSLPQAPIVSLPPLMQPQIFGALQRTPVGASVGVTAGYLKSCGVKYTRAARPEIRSVKGGSGHTTLVFAPHPTYLELERGKGDVLVEEVTPPTFSPDPVSGVVCLGTMTVFSQDGAATGFETIVADLSQFPFDNMKGIREVVIVAIPAGIASAGGVSASANSYGIGSGISHVISAVTAGTITPSYSGGGAESKPQEWLGGTFIILGLAESGKTIVPSDFGALFNQPPQNGSSGNNGAKAEAAK